MAVPTKPKTLGAAGTKFWRSIVTKYELRPDEIRLVADASAEVDLIELIAADLVGAKLEARGSMGQPVINPLIPELRQHRATLAGLLRQLSLPDADVGAGATSGARSASARTLANARWQKRGA